MTPATLKDPRQTACLTLSVLIFAPGCSTTALENSVARALKEKAYPWMQYWPPGSQIKCDYFNLVPSGLDHRVSRLLVAAGAIAIIAAIFSIDSTFVIPY